MAWGRIDDKLYSHRKTMRIPRAQRCAAIGLWTLAVSWSNNHETDGHVPRDIWDEFGTTEDIAETLVSAGYWIATDDGYLITNWGEYNLTSDDLKAKREAEAERKRKWRDAKRARSAASPTDVPAGQGDTSEPVPPDSVTTQSLSLTHTQKNSSSKSSKDAPAKPPDPPGFAEFWATYPSRQARAIAVKAYSKALKTTDAAVILDGARRYASDPNRSDQFTANPATWLNGERWSDDPLPDRSSRASPPPGPSRGDQKVQNILDIGSRLMGDGRKEITQ